MYRFFTTTEGIGEQSQSLADWVGDFNRAGTRSLGVERGRVPLVQTLATFAIFNDVGSEKIIKLERLETSQHLCILTTNAFPAVYSLGNVASYTTEREFTPTKMNSAGTAWPSAIKVRTVGSVSSPTSTIIRKPKVCNELNQATTVFWSNAGASAATKNPLARRVMVGNRNSVVQSITIRPGEIIALTSVLNATDMADCGALVDLTLRVAGESYHVSCLSLGRDPNSVSLIVNSTHHAGLVVIDNQSGSDVVYLDRLDVIPLPYSGEGTAGIGNLAQITFEPIIAAVAGLGTAVSVTKMDSTADAVPASIRILKGAFVQQPTKDHDQVTDWHDGWWNTQRWRRNCLPHAWSPTTYLTPSLMNCRTNHQCDYRGDSTITIREGEGVAIFVKGDAFERETTAFGQFVRPYIIEGSFRLVDNPPPPAGGGGSPFETKVFG